MAARTATAGDNHMGEPGELTPAQQRALYMHHFQKVLAQRAIVDAARAEEKRLRKQAKVDGIAGKELDYGIRCATIEDSQIIADEQERQNQIARWMGLPIGEQSSFDFDREPIVTRAKREGAAAGYANKDRSAPYAVDSKPGQAWLKSYDEARSQQIRDLADAMEIKAREQASIDDDDGEHDPDDDDETEDEREAEAVH